MSAEYLRITPLQLVAAALLLGVNAAISARLRLGLGRRLVWAAVRMSAQLLAVGVVLEWIFRLDHPAPVVAVALAMATMAGVSAVGRSSRKFIGIYWDSLVSIIGSAFLVTGVAVIGILGVRPWYEAQYLIPLLGMVLGNALNGISLGLDHFTEGLTARRAMVETRLALGATRWEAVHEEIRSALRVGMIPTINSMMVMGIVSLPGMMTGQILGGVRPIDAVRYQIVIMFMIASATALGTLGAVGLGFRALMSPAHRLREGVMAARPKR